MPYDLYVSRGVFFGVEAGPDAPPAPEGRAPLTAAEFHEALQGPAALQVEEHAYWVRHPDGDPWFVGVWKPQGQILLTTSTTHHRYLRNLADMVEHGLELAARLGAHLFEEVRGEEITPARVDDLLEPRGEYLQQQAAAWRAAIEQMSSELGAPLELPLGPIDRVSEYFVLHLAPGREIDGGEVSGVLSAGVAGARVQAVEVPGGPGPAAAPGAWLLLEADEDRPLTKVLRLDDGRWQLWPFWGRSPFSRLAGATLDAAEALERAAGGELRFLDVPVDAALRAELRARVGGLGLEAFLWVQQRLRSRAG